MSDLALTTSSEALLSGKAPTFRLLVWAVEANGEPVPYVTYVVSESFVVRGAEGAACDSLTNGLPVRLAGNVYRRSERGVLCLYCTRPYCTRPHWGGTRSRVLRKIHAYVRPNTLRVPAGCGIMLPEAKPTQRSHASALQCWQPGAPVLPTPPQVATKRVKHAIKADVPSVGDHVSKLLHIGKATVDKLLDLRGAFTEEGERRGGSAGDNSRADNHTGPAAHPNVTRP